MRDKPFCPPATSQEQPRRMYPSELKFQNATFLTGLNLSVRLGDQWAGFDGLIPARAVRIERVMMPVTGLPEDITVLGDQVGLLHVEHTYTTTFLHLPPAWLVFANDPACHSLPGLYRCLRDIYVDAFSADAVVTALFFRCKWRD